MVRHGFVSTCSFTFSHDTTKPMVVLYGDCCLSLPLCIQECALEVFSDDGRNHFLVFEKETMPRVYQK